MQDPQSQDSASDKDGYECAAAESDEQIVDKTIPPSLMKTWTRSKSRKFVQPEPLLCSESEDEQPQPQPRW